MQTSMNGSTPSFSEVVLATDFSAASRAAFQTALGLCTALLASLSILHVFEYADAVPPETGGQLHELDSFYQTDQNSLDSLREEALQAGVSCEATMVCGSASLMIIKMIRADKIDLVVLGTSALHGFERLVFGSTAEAVLREAPAPS